MTVREQNSRRELAKEFEKMLVESGSNGTIAVYGSSDNGTGFGDANLNLAVLLMDKDAQDVFDKLRSSMPGIDVSYFTNHSLSKVVVNFSARGSRLSVKNGYYVEMVFWNLERLRHNKMWKFLFGVEPLFRDLVLINKFWMKKAKMIKFDRITSFAFIHIVLFYLQSRGMLPAIMDIRNRNDDPRLPPEFNKPASKPSLAELFVGFFEFYSKSCEKNRIIDTLSGISNNVEEKPQFFKIPSFSTGENLSTSMCLALGDVISEAINRLDTNESLIVSEQNVEIKARELMSDLIRQDSLVMVDRGTTNFSTRLRTEQNARNLEVKMKEYENLDDSKSALQFSLLGIELIPNTKWEPL